MCFDGGEHVIDSTKAYHLQKALYGYRRSPLLWSAHFAQVIRDAKTKRLTAEPSLYSGTHYLLRLVHIDDFMTTGREDDVD